MEFYDVVKRRSSTRKFSTRKVDRDIIYKILEAGNLAPTAKNKQPQYIYVVESDEGLKKLDEVTPCRYNSSCSMIVCSNKIEAFTKGDYSTYEMDATIVATIMMLAAENLNVDSIWIEMFDANKLKKVFNLDDKLEPICILNFGYRALDCPESPNHNRRKDLSEICTFI